MSAIRVTASILLGLALLASAVLVLVPLGTAWNEPADSTVRNTQTYYLFTKDVDVTQRGEEASGDGGATYRYFDEALTGTDGIKGLRAFGPIVAGAMLMTVVGLLLSALPGTRQSRAGGVFALFALGLFGLASVGAYLGITQHTAHQLSQNTEVGYNYVALGAWAAAILLAAVSTGLGLARARRPDPEDAMVWDAAPAAERRLRCPDCSTLVAAPVGLVPICPNCEFGSDYVGPAGQPVPGRAVTA